MQLRRLGTEQKPTYGPDGQGAGYVHQYVDQDGVVRALTDEERNRLDSRWTHARNA